mmetsp:Transcript_116737/g.330233  ORF Transcript_116737/g.330233 Transcript_116737/m.330233 type:complete len:346 (+) Transcript_116737:85-1122(+)
MVRVAGAPLGVEVHQLLCGRDVAIGSDPISHAASQMANYMYVVIDSSGVGGGRPAIVIDACWDVDGILRYCNENLGVERVTNALYTHRHFDHTGGTLPRAMTGGHTVTVPGLHSFVERGIDVAVGQGDVEAVAEQSSVDASKIRALVEGDMIAVGGGAGAALTVLCTPGHTTGSICLQLQDHDASSLDMSPSMLFTGDTLFIGSCGRYDLPESDLSALLASLERLSRLPRQTVVLPGHNYAEAAHTTIGAERTVNNMMLQAMGLVRNGKTVPSSVAASLPLPDYLGVATRLATDVEAVASAGNNGRGATEAFDSDLECCHSPASGRQALPATGAKGHGRSLCSKL